MRIATTLLLALVLSGCGDLEPPFDFSASSSGGEGVESANVTSPGPALVRIRGTFEAPNNCHNVTGHLESGNTLTVTVRSTATAGPECGTDAVFVGYTGVVSGLSSGTYGVLVIHAPQGVEPRTVLESDIFVE